MTMNNETIENLSNEERDKLAHAILTGNCKHKSFSRLRNGAEECNRCKVRGQIWLNSGKRYFIEREFNYSTDIADADKLLKFAEKTHHARMTTPFNLGDKYLCGFTPLGVTGWNGKPDIVSDGESLPQAITKAFILSFGGEK